MDADDGLAVDTKEVAGIELACEVGAGTLFSSSSISESDELHEAKSVRDAMTRANIFFIMISDFVIVELIRYPIHRVSSSLSSFYYQDPGKGRK